VHAVVDHALGRLDGGQPAQIRKALFGDDHVHIMVGVVDVSHERHDGGNVAVLGRGSRHEDADTSVPGEVTRATDTVHHVSAADVSGVHVAVDIHFQCRVEGNDTQAANDFRMVG